MRLSTIKLHVSLFIIVATLIPLCAEISVDDKFNEATKLYSEKEIEKALTVFEEILHEGYDNFHINYNIGCCYFKLDQLGAARFYFERALFYKPFNEDLYHNLILVYKRLLKTPSHGEQIIMNRRITNIIPMSVLLYIVLFTIIITAIFLIIFFKTINHKKIYFILFSISSLFMTLFSIFYFIQYYEYNKKTFTVVSQTADVHISPDDSDTIILTMPEGTNGKISEKVDEYIRIRLNDGLSGWVKRENTLTNLDL